MSEKNGLVKLSDKTIERNQRFKIFEDFHKKAVEIFNPYKTKGEREKYFDALYNLNVVPGGRWGGQESRVVDISWGQRIYDKEERKILCGKKQISFESEGGTTMLFYKNSDGFVSIRLYPAFTNYSQPIEDFIVWKTRLDPAKLFKKRFQKKCWNYFMAYMECTSLDGSPSIVQKIRVWYMRNFKNVVENEKRVPKKINTFLNKFFTWVMTVGFSGLVIFLLQLWLSPNPSEHNNVVEIKNANLRSEKTIDSIHQELLLIKDNQDSILLQTNQKTDSRCSR